MLSKPLNIDTYGLIFASVILLLIAGLASLFSGTLQIDESVFMYIGKEMKYGYMPYKDIWDHKGLPIYFFAFLANLFGNYSVQSGRIIVLLFSLTGAILLFHSLKNTTSWRICLLLSAFGIANVALTSGFMTEQIEAGSVMLGYGFFLISLGKRSNRNQSTMLTFFSGVFFSLALLTRVQGIIHCVFVICLVFILFRKRVSLAIKYVSIMCIGGLLPLIIMITWINYYVGLDNFTEAYIFGNLLYASSVTSIIGLARGLIDNTLPLLGAFSFLFIVGGYGLTRISPEKSASLVFFAVLVLSIIEALFTFAGIHAHYWVLSIWLLSIAASFSIEKKCVPGLRGNLTEDYGMVFAYSIVFMFLFLQVCRPTIARMLQPKSIIVANQISEYVQPGDKLWVAGSSGAQLYYYTNTHPATKYIYTGAAASLVLNPSEVIMDISDSNSIIVLGPDWYDGNSFTSTSIPAIADYVSNNYENIENIYDESTGKYYGVFRSKAADKSH